MQKKAVALLCALSLAFLAGSTLAGEAFGEKETVTLGDKTIEIPIFSGFKTATALDVKGFEGASKAFSYGLLADEVERIVIVSIPQDNSKKSFTDSKETHKAALGKDQIAGFISAFEGAAEGGSGVSVKVKSAEFAAPDENCFEMRVCFLVADNIHTISYNSPMLVGDQYIVLSYLARTEKDDDNSLLKEIESSMAAWRAAIIKANGK